MLSASPTRNVGPAVAFAHSGDAEPVCLVSRSDDGGVCHSVHVALENPTWLNIDCADYNLGTALNNPQFREIAEHLAKEYRLGMMQHFREARHSPRYDARPQDKTESLIALTTRLDPGFTLPTHRQLIAMRSLRSIHRPEG
jgi:nucleoside-diphosphate-sugar epimerase